MDNPPKHSQTLTPRIRGRDCCRSRVQPDISSERAGPLARTYAALGDPTRLRLLDVLARHEGAVCVCDLVDAFGLSQPTISHHLRVLRSAGLVDGERRGVWTYHFLRRDTLRQIGAHLEALRGEFPAAPGGETS